MATPQLWQPIDAASDESARGAFGGLGEDPIDLTESKNKYEEELSKFQLEKAKEEQALRKSGRITAGLEGARDVIRGSVNPGDIQSGTGVGLSMASSGLSGAASGAALGSVIPGVGTGIGAAVGGISGLVLGGLAASESLKANRANRKATEKQNRYIQMLNERSMKLDAEEKKYGRKKEMLDSRKQSYMDMRNLMMENISKDQQLRETFKKWSR